MVPSPAENAATVREADAIINEVMSHVDYDRKVRFPNELREKIIQRLLAQAEAAELYKADRDEYDALLGRKMAERDAAVEEARKNFEWAKAERAGRKQERARADAAVREGLRVEARGFLGILVVPQAERILVHRAIHYRVRKTW